MSDKEHTSIRTADGEIAFPGDAVWIKHKPYADSDEGVYWEQRTIARCLGGGDKAAKVEYTVPCSEGYTGGRWTVIYRRKPEVSDAGASHTDGGDSQHE